MEAVRTRTSYERPVTYGGVQTTNVSSGRTITGGHTTTTTYGNPTSTNIRTGSPVRTTFSSGIVRNGPVETTTTTTSNYHPGITRTSHVGTLGANGIRTSGYATRTSQVGAGYTTTSSAYPGAVHTTQYSGVRQLSPTITSVNRGGRQSHVIEVKEGETRFLEERYVGERVVNVTTHALEERIISTAKPELHTRVTEVETWEDEPVV